MAEENSLRSAVDRILGAPAGGGPTTSANATSAGTQPGAVQLAASSPINWANTLGTTVGISNNLPPASTSAEDKMLADIRAQTALLQQQTAALGNPAPAAPAASGSGNLPAFDPSTLGTTVNPDGSVTRRYLAGTEPPPMPNIAPTTTVSGNRTTTTGFGLTPPGPQPRPIGLTAAQAYSQGMAAAPPMSPQLRLAGGTVPLMGYISTPMGTSRNPVAPSYATPTNPSANPTGWLGASYAAANAAYPNAQAPAPVSTFKLPITRGSPMG
jgi:hypothetical protein